MSTETHTELPWQCTGGDIWIDTREQVCCGRSIDECCGNPDIRGGQDLIAQSNPTDAAFIVRAVNSHHALVAALEPFARNVNATSLSEALGHITREHLLAARAVLSSIGGGK